MVSELKPSFSLDILRDIFHQSPDTLKNRLYKNILDHSKHLNLSFDDIYSIFEPLSYDVDLVEEDYANAKPLKEEAFDKIFMRINPSLYQEFLPRIVGDVQIPVTIETPIQPPVKAPVALKHHFHQMVEKLGKSVQVEVFDEALIHNYSPTISNQIVISSMGTGKTLRMVEYFNEHKPKYNIFVTPRTSLAYEIHSILTQKLVDDKGNQIYDVIFYHTLKESIDPIDLTSPERPFILIIQLESLPCLLETGFPTFDTVFLDEATSVMNQWSSSTMEGRFFDSRTVFDKIVKHTRQLFIMDAFLDERAFILLKSLRNTEESIHLQVNLRGKNDIQAVQFSNKSQILSSILTDISCNKNLFVACNSKTEALTLKLMINNYFPDIKVLCHHGDNSSSGEMKIKMRNINYHWKDYQIVICTPTITVGMSFTEHHFHRCYSFLTGDSCCMRDILQMQCRPRNLEDQLIIFHVEERHRNRYVNPKVIKKVIINKILHNEKVSKELIGSVDYDSEGITFLSSKSNRVTRKENGSFVRSSKFDDWFFDIHCLNIAEQNRTFNNPLEEYVSLMKQQGYLVSTAEDYVGKDNEQILKDMATDGEMILLAMKDLKVLAKEELLVNYPDQLMSYEDYEKEKLRAHYSGNEQLIMDVKCYRISSHFNFTKENDDGTVSLAPVPRELFHLAEKTIHKIKCAVLEKIIQTEDDQKALVKYEKANNSGRNPYNPSNRICQLNAVRKLLNFLGHQGETIELEQYVLTNFDIKAREGENILIECCNSFGINAGSYSNFKKLAAEVVKKTLTSWIHCDIRTSKKKISYQVNGEQKKDSIYTVRIDDDYLHLIDNFNTDRLKNSIEKVGEKKRLVTREEMIEAGIALGELLK